MPATRRDRKVLKEILAGFPEFQRKNNHVDGSSTERKPASRRNFSFKKARFPRAEQNRGDRDYER